MPTCSNCNTNVPIRKSIAGRTLDKQDRDCPDCGKPLDETASERPHGLRK